jgi:hypothetical protein
MIQVQDQRRTAGCSDAKKSTVDAKYASVSVCRRCLPANGFRLVHRDRAFDLLSFEGGNGGPSSVRPFNGPALGIRS